jgi:phosphohistidine phosphatase
VKTLTILRHAKSSWDDPVADFDRPLNVRGRKAAVTVGEELRRRGAKFDCVIASPAKRVRQTLDQLAKGYGKPLDVHFDERIYLASADNLLDLVRGITDDVHSALIVGHNPGLHRLALLLTRDDGALRRQIADKYPTGAAATVDLDAGRWREVEPDRGELSALILPRDLD